MKGMVGLKRIGEGNGERRVKDEEGVRMGGGGWWNCSGIV
jgi:hypothetical protein